MEDVALTIVVELFHGLYLPDFTAYFGVKYDKSVMRIHSPTKFAKKFNRSTWMAFIDKKVLETSSIDLPLNLPTKMTESGASTFENKILIDSPRNTVLLQSVLQNTKALYKNQIPNDFSTTAVRDKSLSVQEKTTFWTNGDKTLINGKEEKVFSFLALPYLPFFSNCDSFDSHMSLSRLVEEHPDCYHVSASRKLKSSKVIFV